MSTRIVALMVISCLVLVIADPRIITKPFDFVNERPAMYSYIKNTSLITMACDAKRNIDRKYCTATLENYNFNGSTEKLSCSFDAPVVSYSYLSVFQISEEHVLVAWLDKHKENERFIQMMNIHLNDCQSTIATLPAPPERYFHYITRLKVVSHKSTYNVIIEKCLENYSKPCKNIYNLDGTEIKTFAQLNPTEELQLSYCNIKSRPADDFLSNCYNYNKSTPYLIKEGDIRFVQIQRIPLATEYHGVYENNITVECAESSDVLNCFIFYGEGTPKYEVNLKKDFRSVIGLLSLTDGFLVSYTKEVNNADVKSESPNNHKIDETIQKIYIRRYDFEGKVVKEHLVDTSIKYVSREDLFQNDAGEYCISLFGDPPEENQFQFFAQCFEDL